MNLGHEEIQAILPDYVRGIQEEDMIKAIETHLHECNECREEYSILVALNDSEIPYPHEAFFEWLPQRVIKATHDCKKTRLPWLSFICQPVAATAVIVVIFALTIFFINKARDIPKNEDHFAFLTTFQDETFYYKDIDELDLPVITELSDETVMPSEEVLLANTYYIDLASLDSESAEGFYKALQKNEGGSNDKNGV
jgi:hypothetical protein